MKKWMIGVGVLLVIGFIAMLVISSIYNGAVNKQNATLAGWSEVENQYQRRADLIPNLVETVKGYATHEETVFTEVTEARASVGKIQLDPTNMTPDQLQQYLTAQGELTQALSKLMVVVESYPLLQASDNFLALQAQLEGTENRIAVARGNFIKDARDYKTHIEKFPNSLICGKFEAIPFFTGQPGSEKVPGVTF